MADRRQQHSNDKLSDDKPAPTTSDIAAATEQHRANSNVFRQLFDTLEAEHRKLNELEKRRAKLTGEMNNLRKLLDAENKKLRAATSAPASSSSSTKPNSNADGNSHASNGSNAGNSGHQQNQGYRYNNKNVFKLFRSKEKPKPTKQVSAKMVKQSVQPPEPLLHTNEQSLQMQPPELCFGTDIENTESVIESLRARFDLSRAEEDDLDQTMEEAAVSYFTSGPNSDSDEDADLASATVLNSEVNADQVSVMTNKAVLLNELLDLNTLNFEEAENAPAVAAAPPPPPPTSDVLMLSEPLSIMVPLPLTSSGIISVSNTVENNEQSETDVAALFVPRPDQVL